MRKGPFEDEVCSLYNKLEAKNKQLKAQAKSLQAENKELRALLKRLEVAETVINLALKEKD